MAVEAWGWDCCGPRGLLDRVYSGLDIPTRSWHGLKCCVEAHSRGGDRSGVQTERWRQVWEPSHGSVKHVSGTSRVGGGVIGPPTNPQMG